MHNGDCYPNGSYFWDNNVNSDTDEKRLSCVLPGTSLTTGQWVRVADPLDPVDCKSNSNDDPFRCTNVTSPNATISLYLAQRFENQEGFYKCCLPTNCLDSGTNIIFANIFSKNAINEKLISHFLEFAQIASFSEPDLPTDMTVYPQKFTLHCVKTGYHLYNFKMNIGNTALASYIGCDSKKLCADSKLLHSSNHTVEHTITVSWDGMTISKGLVSQPLTGDQDYQCTVEVTDQPIRMRNVTIQGIFSY